MATGLAQTASIIRYATTAHGLIALWAGYTKDQRASYLINAAHAELTHYSVPNPPIAWENFSDDAQFDFTNWQVKLSNAVWNQNPPNGTPAEQRDFKRHIAELADTVYHECRHCEQWFRMARYLASKTLEGKSKKAAISNMTGIPVQIARSAKYAGQLSDEERQEGKDWYNAVYGKNEAPPVGGKGKKPVETPFGNINRREFVLAHANLRTTQTASVSSAPTSSGQPLNETPSERTMREIRAARELERGQTSGDRQMSQYLQYRELLPEEQDAHSVGTAVQTKFYQLAGLLGAPTQPKHTGVREFLSPNVGVV